MSVTVEKVADLKYKATFQAHGKEAHIVGSRHLLEAYALNPLGFKNPVHNISTQLGLDDHGAQVLGRQLGIALSRSFIVVIVRPDQAEALSGYGYEAEPTAPGDDGDPRLRYRLEATELMSLGLCLDEIGYDVGLSPAAQGPADCARIDLTNMKRP